MTLAAVNITIGQLTDTESAYSTRLAGASVPAAASTTAVAADVATLVADGASPTQAHVTTLNTDWGTLLTAINAINSVATTGDVTVIWNAATITKRNQLRAALKAALKAVEAGYGGLVE